MTALAPVIRAVDHIGIVVHDVDAAVSYYAKVLGMPVVDEETLAERSARIVFVDAGNVLIQFVQPTAPGPVADFLEQRGEGLHHICFAVPDIPDALRVIASETIDGVFSGGRGHRACFLRERPAGIRIELYEDPIGARVDMDQPEAIQ
jgi:methylmalonyl-CoA/ethylmalonyl-CoA epimerase